MKWHCTSTDNVFSDVFDLLLVDFVGSGATGVNRDDLTYRVIS